MTRAITNLPASDVSDKRGIIIMDIYDIPGPFTFHYYSDVVKVFDFSWGASRTIGPDGGGSGTLPEFKNLSILKEIDRTSVPLLEEFFTVGIIPEVIFYF